jgi:predicted AAA+ superfamily ATPase
VRYVPRLADARLDEVMAVFPAVLLLGPRAVGKTTTARRHAATVVELDDPAQAAQFRADPTAALDAMRRRSDGPLLLDEWQEVPEVLGAIKRSVDQGVPPGSYLLTGSVRAPLMSASWPGTGRIITVDMHPITVLEQRSSSPPRSELVPRIMAGRVDDLPLPSELPDLVGYVELAARGGFPPVVGVGDNACRLWLDSYVDQLVLRDVSELGEIRDPAALRRLIRALTECTGTVTADTELAAAADMNVKTVRRQERLLEDLRIVTSLPAWHSNRISRLIKQRKRYAVDTGMVAALLEVDATAVLANGDLLGHMLETFTLSQLRPLLAVADRRVVAHHLRQQDGRHEVDVILEAADGHIVGIEIKASAGPSTSDAKHLAWLRDELADRFTCGIVLHTGKAIYSLGERVTAAPIAALWG